MITAKKQKKPQTIDQYLTSTPKEKRIKLQKLRELIHRHQMDLSETIKYGVPAFVFQTKVIAGFASTKTGFSYYPFSGRTLGLLKNELKKYSQTKSSLHFSCEDKISSSLIRKLITQRKKEILSSQKLK